VSLGFLVLLASVLLVGWSGTVFVAFAGAFAYNPGGLPSVKRAFNAAQDALCGALAGGVLILIQPGGAGALKDSAFPRVLFATLLVGGVFCLANSGLVSGIVALASGQRFGDVWLANLKGPVLPMLGYIPIAIAMAALWSRPNPASALLLIVPLFIARHVFGQYLAEQEAYDATVAALMAAVETKDFYTRGHSERVSRGAAMIAEQRGLRGDRLASIKLAGMLHDVGKLSVPTAVLRKEGRLTDGEYDAIRQHPGDGVQMLRDIEFLGEVLEGIHHHHERMDGRGYPQGLSGHDIPEFARMICVADAFDSITTTRAYRGARSTAEGLAELERCAGTQFDPVFVEAFVEAVRRNGWQSPDEPVAAEQAAEEAAEEAAAQADADSAGDSMSSAAGASPGGSA
jgi:putative nucleotidyltransferase with HDIG domain